MIQIETPKSNACEWGPCGGWTSQSQRIGKETNMFQGSAQWFIFLFSTKLLYPFILCPYVVAVLYHPHCTIVQIILIILHSRGLPAMLKGYVLKCMFSIAIHNALWKENVFVNIMS